MALDTVEDYITASRDLLQDTVDSPYRYTTTTLVNALNFALLEIRKLRPDILLDYLTGATVPDFTAANAAPGQDVTVPVDYQYRMAVVYYICGHAQLRDEDNTQDARSAAFLNKFTSQLLQLV